MKQAKTKCDVVVDEILAMIAKGQYKANEKLPPESYFVDYFGFSRVTIRESFKKLNMLGVVTIRQGEGTFVNQIDFSTVMKPLYSTILLNDLNVSQIYDARKYIEAGTAQLAAKNRTEEEFAKLEQLMDRMRIVTMEKDTAAFNELDKMFHKKIAEAAKNQIMLTIYRSVQDVIESYITRSNLSLEIVENSVKHHAEILEAIQKKDEKAAYISMEKHVFLTKEALMAKMKAEGVPSYIQIEN